MEGWDQCFLSSSIRSGLALHEENLYDNYSEMRCIDGTACIQWFNKLRVIADKFCQVHALIPCLRVCTVH